MTEMVYRTCSLCEAACGLAFEVDGDRIVSVRGDEDDVLSHGYICPKGAAIAAVHDDPDRLRQPMQRQKDGSFAAISWDEAFAITAQQLQAIKSAHGANAIATYIGNPIVHNHGAATVRSGLLKALGTQNSTSAGSQDTSPRFAASYYLYGASFSVPVPDIERTHFFLCVGANPYVSNGSFLSAPDIKNRLRALRRRGGKLVVVDPRRSETAREADEHVAIRPGGDAAFLLALAQVLVAQGKVREQWLAQHTTGWSEVKAKLASFTPERVAPHTGIAASTIERLALELAAAPSAAIYSRIGVCNNQHGTLASFATDLLSFLLGQLGKEGGAMFPSPAFDIVETLRMVGGDGHNRWRTRVRGLPETLGDVPASTLAEEIETPGAGQVRGFLCFAGNPVLSTPNGQRLSAALEKLEFMVAIDLYINETTRHAHIILPPAWGLADDHIDLVFSNFFIRDVARWSPPVVKPKAGEWSDWRILLEISERMGGGMTGIGVVDAGLRLLRRLGAEVTPSALLALGLRTGPYGDKFLPWSKGLNLDKLRAAPHGIDLGPLKPGFHRRILHGDGKIHMAAQPFLKTMDELATSLQRVPDADELLLIGRRELRTCNSWMHNVPALVAGRERCVLLVHPDDARRAGVSDGDMATMESRVHEGEVRVQLSDSMCPGVVSLPHGWGHAAVAPWQKVAGAHPGVSANDWTDDQLVESVVGQAVLNGVPVRLRARQAAAAA